MSCLELRSVNFYWTNIVLYCIVLLKRQEIKFTHKVVEYNGSEVYISEYCAAVQTTATYSESAFDYLSSIIIDTTPQHGRHFFDVNCQVCTGKIPDPLYSDDHKAAGLVHATPADETAQSDDTVTAPAVVDMSRDPRRSRSVQVVNSATTAAVKTEISKPEPPLKPEPSPRESVTAVPLKSEQSTVKSPTSTTSMVLPPLPAYQLWVTSCYSVSLL